MADQNISPPPPAAGAPAPSAMGGISPKSRLAAALFCWFFGIFGGHRFYVGKTKSAILMLVTLGGLGIWALIDFIMILAGKFTDKEGLVLSKW